MCLGFCFFQVGFEKTGIYSVVFFLGKNVNDPIQSLLLEPNLLQYDHFRRQVTLNRFWN